MTDWFADFDPNKKIPLEEDWLTISDEEIDSYTDRYMKRYKDLCYEFEEKSSLTSLDLKVIIAAAALQVLRWSIIDNASFRFDTASDADKAIADVGSYFPATIESLLSDHTVPYDAVQKSEKFAARDINTGLSGANHRTRALGHDPIFGWIVGTANIATNTLTVNEISSLFPSYHIKNQQIDSCTSFMQIMKWTFDLLKNDPEVVALSFAKQAVHYSTDIFTKQGLPTPILNVVSPDTARYLTGENIRIDFYSITRGAALSMLVNKMVEMFHRLWLDPTKDSEEVYKARTLKVVCYSNILASTSNILYTFLSKDFLKLDIGGMLVTLWRIFSDRKKIKKLKEEFVNKVLNDELQKEEDKVNKMLDKWGYNI